MILEPRLISEELKKLHALGGRMVLEGSEQKHYFILKKGFDGESEFDRMLSQLNCENLILCDIWLEVQNSQFQIDTLMILPPNTIFAFEIKNYEGDYYIDKDNWFTTAHNEIKNPLNQVERNESLFRRYLQKFKSPYTLKYLAIFINPEFTLYQAPLNKPMIFPTQLKQFLKRIDENKKKLNQVHMNLAKQILADKCPPPDFKRLPDYQYEQLQKGILCKCCNSIDTYVEKDKVVCNSCHSQENVDMAILRSVDEFHLLFPNEKITTVAIHHWCRIIESKKTIRRVFRRNYIQRGYGKYTHYLKE